MKLTYADYSDVGGRKNNEDSYAVAFAEHGYLFLVADGLGGHDNGEEASQIAVDEIKSRFLAEGEGFNPEAAIYSANLKILQKQAEEGSKMKTTITLAWVGKGVTRFAHVGDSRIYAFNKEGIVYQSPDHSVSQMAVAVGEITAAEIRHHVDRNKLTRALGVDADIKSHSYQLPNSDYEGLLLCSDGFWEYVLEDEMCALFGSSSSPAQWLEAMRGLVSARVPANNDNNTAVVAFKEAEPVVACHCAAPAQGVMASDKKKQKKTLVILSIITAVLLVVVISFACILIFGGKDDEDKDVGGTSSEESVEESSVEEASNEGTSSEGSSEEESIEEGVSEETSLESEDNTDGDTSGENTSSAWKRRTIGFLSR